MTHYSKIQDYQRQKIPKASKDKEQITHQETNVNQIDI